MARTGSGDSSKTKLLDAAVSVIRIKGYEATTIDDICQRAKITKGSFFHHFESKETLAVSAARHFAAMADTAFSTAPYQQLMDPIDRLLGYVDFRKAILQGELWEFTCLLGTMVQEVYQTHPVIREACDISLHENVSMVEADIAEAIRQYNLNMEWTAESLALHIQSVIQGAFILAKAQNSRDVAVTCLDHLRHYLELLFSSCQRKDEVHA